MRGTEKSRRTAHRQARSPGAGRPRRVSRMLRFYPTGANIGLTPASPPSSPRSATTSEAGRSSSRAASGRTRRPSTPPRLEPQRRSRHGLLGPGCPQHGRSRLLPHLPQRRRRLLPEQLIRSPGCTGRAGVLDRHDPAGSGEAPHYDSPNAQHDADEAARDVEPHGGASDAPAPDAGSNDTQ